MVDIVRYEMQGHETREVVGSHVDPGLFVLSLPATAPGLEMKADGMWVAPPLDYGVLWAGAAAERAGLAKAGWHRAVTSLVQSDPARLAIWHELCTGRQLSPPMLARLEEEGLELKFGLVRGTGNVLELLRSAEDGRGTPDAVNAIPQPQQVPFRVPVGKSQVSWQSGNAGRSASHRNPVANSWGKEGLAPYRVPVSKSAVRVEQPIPAPSGNLAPFAQRLAACALEIVQKLSSRNPFG